MKTAEICRRTASAGQTAYKWLRRYEEEGEAGLKNAAERPRTVHADSRKA
jgi:transposase